MSKSILRNYVPALDEIIQEMGAITALVFGRIWRYCQGEYDECFASQETIAKELGLSRPCINQHIKKLVEAGYLQEVERAGITNVYRATGKAVFKTEELSTTCKNPLQVDKPPVNDVYNTCKNGLHPPVNDVYTKIDIKKESKKEVEYIDGDPDEIFTRMQQMCEKLIGRFSTPADIPTLDLFIREGITEADIKGALAWRSSQKLKPAANIKQLEAGVLRNKAERAQSAAAENAPRYPTPRQMSTLERSLAAGREAMAEALEEERLKNVQQG